MNAGLSRRGWHPSRSDTVLTQMIAGDVMTNLPLISLSPSRNYMHLRQSAATLSTSAKVDSSPPPFSRLPKSRSNHLYQSSVTTSWTTVCTCLAWKLGAFPHVSAKLTRCNCCTVHYKRRRTPERDSKKKLPVNHAELFFSVRVCNSCNLHLSKERARKCFRSKIRAGRLLSRVILFPRQYKNKE